MRQEEIGGFNESFERYRDRITNFSNEFEFGLFVHILKRSLPFIVSILFVCVLGAIIYLRYTVPIYESKTTLQIEKSDQAKMVLKVENFGDPDNLYTDVELIRSQFILEKSVNRLGLNVRYFEEGQVRGSENYRNSPYEIQILAVRDSLAAFDKRYDIVFDEKGTFSLGYGEINSGPHSFTEEIELGACTIVVLLDQGLSTAGLLNRNSYYFTLPSLASKVNEFSQQLSVSVLNPTAKTIQISYQNPNARLARDLVMNHAQAFLEFNQARKEQSSQKVLAFIDTQLDTVAENLRNAEFLLNSFKQEHKLSHIENISDIYLGRLNDFDEKIFKLDLEAQTLERLETVESGNLEDLDLYQLIAMTVGTRFESSLQVMLTELADLLRQKEEYYFEVTDDSDVIKSLDYRIKIQKDLIVQSIEALREKNSAERAELKKRSAAIEGQFSGLPTQELEYARYKRLYSINERYYSNLLEKRIEYRISKAGFVSENKILEAGQVASSPIKPNRNLIYTGFIGLGIVLSLLFVVVRYLLHNNITSLTEIAKLSNATISILGIIPKYKEKIPVSQLIIGRKPKSLIAESFRTVRTNLEFLSDVQGSKVMAITSTISSEGKTFVALNLAGIIALSGKKVVILDLDMRRPKIHKGFGVDNNKGMSTMLINKHSFEECVRHSDMQGLDFITAGPIAPNPSELMISPRMTEIIEEAKEKYDMVVIDNPPVGLVTDGIASIKIADYPIYIFRADYSKKHFVQNVDRLINENGITKLSVILNGVDIERNKYGSYYGYGYGYGYGYAYGGGHGYNNGYYDGEDSRSSWLQRLKRRVWK
jgi:capsular exopolysaccharide synthesis family protein